MTLIFATQSANKLEEAQRILRTQIETYEIDLPEIQSVDVEDVVIYKAKFAYDVIRKPIMIEDTGLYINALNGLPGALIKWFVQRIGVDGLCRIMEPFDDKSAVAKTIIATYDGYGDPSTFAGEIGGGISGTPRGTQGFGWDAVFIPAGAEKTFAEMLPDEKDAFSMRRLALEKMKDSMTLK
jgi:non-canonical purine NTP pyrophosphatase (RdgB/HAM1 family)